MSWRSTTGTAAREGEGLAAALYELLHGLGLDTEIP
jgi:hypothetical protein